jgi:hypothetical protein
VCVCVWVGGWVGVGVCVGVCVCGCVDLVCHSRLRIGLEQAKKFGVSDRVSLHKNDFRFLGMSLAPESLRGATPSAYLTCIAVRTHFFQKPFPLAPSTQWWVSECGSTSNCLSIRMLSNKSSAF